MLMCITGLITISRQGFTNPAVSDGSTLRRYSRAIADGLPHPAIDPSGKMVATCDEHPPLVSGNVDGRLRGVSVV